MTRVSERLRNAALEIATVADIGPRELNKLELAKIAARILRAADEVELGELNDPSRAAPETTTALDRFKCPTCERTFTTAEVRSYHMDECVGAL